MDGITLQRPNDDLGAGGVMVNGNAHAPEPRISLEQQPPKPKLKPVVARSHPMAQVQPTRMPPPHLGLDMDETFAQLANPAKHKTTRPQFNSDGSSDGGSVSGTSGSGNSMNNDSDADDPKNADDESLPEEDPYNQPLQPSEGYTSLEEEKADILLKLTRLKRQGIAGLRAFGPHSDIRDLRTELARIKSEIDIEASIKFQRKILMAVISTIEFLNKRYDPFDLHLDGFGEHTMDSIDDYNRVFERLYFKYKNRVSMPPEMELLVTVGGSAFMFHLSHTLMKQSLPSLSKNPELMNSMMNAMAQAQQQQQQQQQQPPADDRPSPSGEGNRREMNGPGIDLSAMMGGKLPPAPQFPPMPVRGDIAPPPPQPARPAPEPKQPLPRDIERLSDIISEDLDDVPDDLQSLAPSESGVKNVKMPPSALKGRKRKPGASLSGSGAAKKVMFL